MLDEIDRMFEMAKEGICPFCKEKVDINDFRDKLSLEEFKISGLCQSCQDEFFKEE